MEEKLNETFQNFTDFTHDLNKIPTVHISEFVDVSKNPYCITIDDYQINLSYADTNVSLYTKLINLIYSQ